MIVDLPAQITGSVDQADWNTQYIGRNCGGLLACLRHESRVPNERVQIFQAADIIIIELMS